MEIRLDSKVLKYQITLTSCLGTKHNIILSAYKYVDVRREYKTAQFLFNETREMEYNLETNELKIMFYKNENDSIILQFDSTNPKHSPYTTILRSLYKLHGTIYTKTSAINENVKDISLHYFPMIYLLLFGETTYCDDIYLPEKEGE